MCVWKSEEEREKGERERERKEREREYVIRACESGEHVHVIQPPNRLYNTWKARGRFHQHSTGSIYASRFMLISLAYNIVEHNFKFFSHVDLGTILLMKYYSILCAQLCALMNLCLVL